MSTIPDSQDGLVGLFTYMAITFDRKGVVPLHKLRGTGVPSRHGLLGSRGVR